MMVLSKLSDAEHIDIKLDMSELDVTPAESHASATYDEIKAHVKEHTGLAVSTQIGEFAFIIASLGVSLKVTSDFLYPIVVAVSVITTFLSGNATIRRSRITQSNHNAQ